MSCTGLKKCSPTKLAGRPEISDICVICREDVLEAKMASGLIRLHQTEGKGGRGGESGTDQDSAVSACVSEWMRTMLGRKEAREEGREEGEEKREKASIRQAVRQSVSV